MVVGAESSLLTVFGPVGAILLYLIYEFHFGKIADFQNTLSALAGAVLALSRHAEEVDERAVAERLPDTVVTPTDLYADDESGDAEQEAVDKLIEIVRERAEEINDSEDDTNQ